MVDGVINNESKLFVVILLILIYSSYPTSAELVKLSKDFKVIRHISTLNADGTVHLSFIMRATTETDDNYLLQRTKLPSRRHRLISVYDEVGKLNLTPIAGEIDCSPTKINESIGYYEINEENNTIKYCSKVGPGGSLGSRIEMHMAKLDISNLDDTERRSLKSCIDRVEKIVQKPIPEIMTPINCVLVSLPSFSENDDVHLYLIVRGSECVDLQPDFQECPEGFKKHIYSNTLECEQICRNCTKWQHPLTIGGIDKCKKERLEEQSRRFKELGFYAGLGGIFAAIAGITAAGYTSRRDRLNEVDIAIDEFLTQPTSVITTTQGIRDLNLRLIELGKRVKTVWPPWKSKSIVSKKLHSRLSDVDYQKKYIGAAILDRVGDDRGLHIIRTGLQNKKREIRERAIEASELARDDRLVGDLLNLARNMDTAAYFALRVLGKVRFIEAFPSLEELFNDNRFDDYDKREIISTMIEIDFEKSAPSIVKALENDYLRDYLMKEKLPKINYELIKINDIAPEIAKRLPTEDTDVFISFLRILEVMKNPEVIPILEKKITDARYASVVDKIRETIEKLGSL